MRRKLIRTLTFLFGLYFVLEFLLPKEIGGDFDKSGIRSPAVLHDAESGEYQLYYVGTYNRREQAVGVATSTDALTWEKSAANPVVRSTLFGSVDRLGFSSLSIVRTDEGYELYYLGSDMDRHRTICWASSPDGVHWEKRGRIQFRGDTPWRQRDEAEESFSRHRYTKLQAIAAARTDGETSLLIAHTNIVGRTHVLVAELSGPGPKWAVKSKPLALRGIPRVEQITSLSYVERNGVPELWMLFANGTVYRASLAPDGVAEQVSFAKRLDAGKAAEGAEVETKDVLPDTINEITVTASDEGYRMWYTRLSEGLEAEEPGEKSHVFSATSADGMVWHILEEEPPTYEFFQLTLTVPIAERPPLFSSGKRARPTYLSRGSVFAGKFLMIIGAFAIGLGAVNMCLVHGRRIAKAQRGLHNSAIFFVCLVSMFCFTMFGKPVSDKLKAQEVKSGEAAAPAGEAAEEAAEGAGEGAAEEAVEQYPAGRRFLANAYDFVFYNVQMNLGASVFALLSFYMVGAAFRSFRIRSAEAVFLVLSAVIVLLGQIPLGTAISKQLPEKFTLPAMSDYLLNVFNAAAYRGVIIGMAMAALSTSVRLWLGLEKGMFHGT